MREPTDFESYTVSLIVVDGAGEGEEYPMDRPRWRVGRGPDVDARFEDPALSPRHGEIAFSAGRFVVTELESGSGIRVNGEAVSECELRHGDRIAFGDRVLQILIARKDAVPLFTPSARGQEAGEVAPS
jgi:pSer/pThr/pTyr-binding forkhead associated (FHA) protein